MRLSLFLTGLLLMTGIAFPAAASEAPVQDSATGTSITVPDPVDGSLLTRLPNGLSILVKKDSRFPLVSLRLYVHAGSAYEDPADAGISHLLEHMVFKGTDAFPKGGIAEAIEKNGGYLNAATSFDYTVYLTDMMAESWDQGLGVLKDMAFHATLDPEELEKEKGVVVAELERGEDTPGQRLFRMAQEAALQGSPYAHPIIGYKDSIRSFTAQRIRDYITRHYQPQSMLLLICGDVDVREAVTRAEAVFGDLSNTHPVFARPALTSGAQRFSLTMASGPWKKAHLAIALPAPGQSDARSPQLDVLAQLLGGDATSRFYRKYKYEQRLVDSISVSNYSFEHTGMIYIQATLDVDKVAPFWTEFTKDLGALAFVKFSPEELARARMNIEDDLFRSKESLPGYASKIGYFAFFDKGEQGEANYLTAVRDTDQTVLEGLVRDIFQSGKASVTGVIPEGAAIPAPDVPTRKAGLKPLPSPAFPDASALQIWMRDESLKNWKTTQTAADTQNASGKAATETVALGDGRTVILIPDNTLPYTSVALTFQGGDTLLAQADQGLTAFTASLLTKGAGKLSATAVNEFEADRAASLSASAGRQSFTLSMSYPARFSADMFGLLETTLTAPAMKKEEAARVRENQIAAITAQEDKPTGLAFRRMFPFLFADHPYGFLVLGEKDRVARFTEKDARAFWKRQVSQPWVLSVCGSFDREAVLQAAAKLPKPEAATGLPLASPQWSADKTLDLTLPGRNQAHLLMVFPTVGLGDRDEPGLDLLQTILAGQSGLLFRDLRDTQGLGYTVTAFPWKTEKTGALIFYIGTAPEKLEQARKGFDTVIAGLHAAPLTDEELLHGKKQMKGDYYREHQTLGSRAMEAAVLTLLHRPLDAERQNVEKAQSVSAGDLQELAKKYLLPEKAYIVTVQP